MFDVHFPARNDDATGGRGKFGAFLRTIHKTSPSFRENVKAVLIVSDNDDDMQESFRLVKAGLEQSGGFGIPDAERVVARSEGYPLVVVVMIPMGTLGNLETIALEAAYSKWEIKPALDAYVNATPAAGWSVGKQSKMRMHALLAATVETKPESSFAHHWQEREEFHIPLDHEAYNDLVLFLMGFEELIGDA